MVENGQVSEQHDLGHAITCLLPLPGNLLLAAMAKGNVVVLRGSAQSGLMIETTLSVPADMGGSSMDQSVISMSASVEGGKVAAFLKHGPIFMIDMQMALHHFTRDIDQVR